MSRRELDFYPTPPWMVQLLLDRVPLCPDAGDPPRILEPCVGKGHIVRAIAERYPGAVFHTNDLDDRHEADLHRDATDARFWELFGEGRSLPRPDWVITNPPFSAAFPIVHRAVSVARVGVAMLLRITWLEPTAERGGWLQLNPPHRLIVLPRFSFAGQGNDSATTAWFIWSTLLQPGIEVVPYRGKQLGLGLTNS